MTEHSNFLIRYCVYVATVNVDVLRDAWPLPEEPADISLAACVTKP